MMMVLLKREIARNYRSGVMLPPSFLFMACAVYPFSLGAHSVNLAQAGLGVIWVALLLSALLPIEKLFVQDLERGYIDQLVLRGMGYEVMATVKLAAHWLSFAPAVLLAVLPSSLILGIDTGVIAQSLAAMLLASLGLAALGIISAAFMGAHGRTALAGLMMIPFAVPLLIFGASSHGGAGLKYLAAISLVYCAFAPFVAGAAIKAHVQAL
jgi:heme exporter protein B